MGAVSARSPVEGSCVLKAPYILTLEGPLLKDHALLIEQGLIKQIVPQKELGGQENCLELPQTILLPGLVNAHCHLELSKLPEPLPGPGSFTAWIQELGRLKLQMTPAQTEAGIRFGIQKLLEGGATTIADHVSPGVSLEPLLDSPLEGAAYIEVLGLEEGRAEGLYRQAVEKSEIQNPTSETNPKSKIRIVPTPHAPYSLLPDIFRQMTTIALSHHRTIAPLSIHIAESFEEYLLFKENRGPLFDFLAAKGKTPPTIGETPLHYLHRMRLLAQRTLAIHANYLDDTDVELLQKHQMSVVHCPGSHAYFGHGRFPLGMLMEAGINVAMGTDSLASNHSLSMFEQMRLALDTYAELTPEAVLRMAALGGARALGMEKEIGSLAASKQANIIGVPLRYPKRSLMENALLAEKTHFTMIHGQLLPSG